MHSMITEHCDTHATQKQDGDMCGPETKWQNVDIAKCSLWEADLFSYCARHFKMNINGGMCTLSVDEDSLVTL